MCTFYRNVVSNSSRISGDSHNPGSNADSYLLTIFSRSRKKLQAPEPFKEVAHILYETLCKPPKPMKTALNSASIFIKTV